MVANQNDGTFTFACRHCKSQIRVGPQHRTYQFFTARCGNCGLRVEHELPSIRKKIIYLDQFLLSNILAKKEDRWQEVHKRLQWLIYLQVVACPYSDIHHDESLVAEHSHSQLKDLCQGLEYYFYHYTSIRKHTSLDRQTPAEVYRSGRIKRDVPSI